MTWGELGRAIELMTPEQRRQKVRFVEPFDKWRCGCFGDIYTAFEDLTVGGGGETLDPPENVFVLEGEPFLSV